MFKEAISSLTASVISAAKSAAQDNIPTSENLHGVYGSIAQYGISNIAYRSPFLANIAQTMLHNWQVESVKKDRIKTFLKSKNSDEMRNAVSSTMDVTATSKQIDKEMTRILDSISKSIEKNGQEEAKKSDIFKQFGKFFSEFKSAEESTENQTKEHNGSGNDDQILTRIETNTHRTVDVLEQLTSKHVVGGNSHSDDVNKSFIDPMTGMPSISAAVGHIGSSFLSKVFDNDTIERFANKTKDFFGSTNAPEVPTARPKETSVPESQETPNAVVEPVAESVVEPIKKPKSRGGEKKSIDSILNGLNLDLNTSVNNAEVVSKDNTSESSKENAIASDKRTEEIVSELKDIKSILSKSHDGIKNNKSTVEKIGDQKTTILDKIKDKVLPKSLKDLPYNIGKNSGKGVAKTIEAAKTAAKYVPKVVEGVGNILSNGVGLATKALPELVGGAELASGGLLAGAGVVGAAGAGYMLGENVINPLVDKGLSAVTGRDTSLGSWIYDQINPDPLKEQPVVASKSAPAIIKPTPIPSKSINSVTALKTEKEKEDIKQSSASQPIIINKNSDKSTSGGNGSSGDNTPRILSIRNQDSTFEKVQMQDFWSRTV